MPRYQAMNESVAVPIASITLSNLLEEINILWNDIYDICKTELTNLAISDHQLYKDFLDYMTLVCSECNRSCNSLDNIHTELLIATEAQRLDQTNAREILGDANKLLQVFGNLLNQSKVIKGRITNCDFNVDQQKKDLSKKNLLTKVSAQLSASTRFRTALFAGISGITASEIFLEKMDSKVLLGLSAATFTTIGISSAIEIWHSGKFEKLRLIVDVLKAKTFMLLTYMDELGAEISGVVDDLRVYATKTEDCMTRPDNLAGERMQAKGKSLIESTLALKASLKQIHARAVDNSKTIRKFIRLECVSGLYFNE